MKLSEIIKTKSALSELGYGLENNIIESIDINTIAHFGNCTCLEIACENICPYSTYNNTKNLGFLIRALIQLLGLEEEDGRRLSKIRKIPCRLVFEGTRDTHWGEKAIGIGHFTKDRFVLFEEFSRIDE